MTAETASSPYVHQHRLDGLGTVRLRPVDPPRDAPLLHTWVTREDARFWGMLDADVARVEEIYAYLDSLTTHHAYLVEIDGTPVALFQTYRPEADPLAECYDVQPGDLGIHLLLAAIPEGAPRRGYTSALLVALVPFVLADEDVRRIVVEPDARNARALARLERTGFTLGPEIDKPEKRARLAFLSRETAAALMA